MVLLTDFRCSAAPTVDVAAEHRKSVSKTIRGHYGDVQACYDRAKMHSPQLSGSVSVSASLTGSGSVSSARVSSSTVRSSLGGGPTMLENCLVDRFRSWVFQAPPPGASNDVSYTFRFE